MGTLAYSEDPDETLHNTVFYDHDRIDLQRKKYNIFGGNQIITCDPSI